MSLLERFSKEDAAVFERFVRLAFLPEVEEGEASGPVTKNDHVGYQWGDTGCAHLTQCPTHPERLAFAWACC